jgi:glycerol-3-phosphate acyltransferase PlsY
MPWALLGTWLASYLVGAIPTAYLVVKWLKRIDVRTVGSGNVGATNVTRAAGLGAGIIVFCIDFAKGLVAALVFSRWLSGLAPGEAGWSCGVLAVMGHAFPVFLGFKGGKGVATTIGVLLGAEPLAALAFLVMWGVSAAIWRYVSVSSMLAALTAPLTLWRLGRSETEILFGAVLAGLIIVRHRANLERLRLGTEPRIGSRRHDA